MEETLRQTFFLTHWYWRFIVLSILKPKSSEWNLHLCRTIGSQILTLTDFYETWLKLFPSMNMSWPFLKSPFMLYEEFQRLRLKWLEITYFLIIRWKFKWSRCLVLRSRFITFLEIFKLSIKLKDILWSMNKFSTSNRLLHLKVYFFSVVMRQSRHNS